MEERRKNKERGGGEGGGGRESFVRKRLRCCPFYSKSKYYELISKFQWIAISSNQSHSFLIPTYTYVCDFFRHKIKGTSKQAEKDDAVMKLPKSNNNIWNTC